jgi:prepilin-type N-terminal cleavage/methylation domain-containing protein
MLRRVPRPRPGFTLIEVLVVLAVLAALVAIIAPMVAGRAREATPAAVGSNLRAISSAVASFRQDVRRYPSSLTYLTTAPAGTPTDACGDPIPPGFVARWEGPYLRRAFPAGGLVSGDALILPDLVRSGGTVGELTVNTIQVDQDAATTLDDEFDGDSNLGAGAIRWSAAGEDTLKFVLSIRGC